MKLYSFIKKTFLIFSIFFIGFGSELRITKIKHFIMKFALNIGLGLIVLELELINYVILELV